MADKFESMANMAAATIWSRVIFDMVAEHAEKTLDFCDKVVFRLWVITIIFLFFRFVENIVTVIYVIT